MTEKDCEDYHDYERAFAKILNKVPECQWDEDIDCPVLLQCYLDVDGGDENAYTLYLRIRSLDYWTFEVIQNLHTDKAKWYTPAGFPYFEEEQLKAAEAWAEYWYHNNKDNIRNLFDDAD